MPKLKYLARAVFGLPTKVTTLDGFPVPESVRGCKAIAVIHDRRLSAGIFELPRKKKKSPVSYRVVTWRTYRQSITRNERRFKAGRAYTEKRVSHRERATTSLHRDELDPMLDLLAKLGERLTRLE